jgi:glycosyltransferase involved in cell wall biosynthesis
VVWQYLRRQPEQRLLYFVFVGGGEKWPQLHRLRDELRLECLEVAPYVPHEQFRPLLRLGDFGLVTLERACVGLMSPGKIHAYLDCGLPLIYLGPDGSNVADVIAAHDCGVRIAEDDPEGWQAWVRALEAGAVDRDALARNAAAAARHYQEEICVGQVVAALE